MLICRAAPSQAEEGNWGQTRLHAELLPSPASEEDREESGVCGVGQSRPFFYPPSDIRLTLRNIRGLGIERGRKRKRRREK